MKTLIQNTATKEYYAVQCSENIKGYLNSANDEGNPDENDFPYWTDDINEAYDFSTKGMAEHEMNCNDVTNSGDITVAIIEA